MNILFLHLSDLHMTSEKDIDEKHVLEIGTAVSTIANQSIDHILLLFTGDIAFSGLPEEYKAFDIFNEKLIQCIRGNVPSAKTIRSFLVPGNHDIDFSHITDGSRKHYEEILKRTPEFNQDEEGARSAFYEHFNTDSPETSFGPRNSRILFELDGINIEVNMLDSTWYSCLHENDQGLHYFPKEKIESLLGATGADMVITLMHHSHQWFNDLCKNELEEVIMKKSTMLFVGHEHYLAHKKTSWEGNDPAHVFCGGELCNKGNWDKSEFFACVLNTEKSIFSHYKFSWDMKSELYHRTVCEANESISLKPSVNLFVKPIKGYIESITRDSHIRLSSDLSTYHVFPGLTKKSSDEQEVPTNIFDFHTFYTEFEKVKRIELCGGEGVGKSSLLKMIFKHYLGRKYILLCQVSDITSGNRSRIIKNLFEATYGENPADYERFQRLDKLQKMILIDDLHMINPRHVSEFLNGIEEDFDYIIYTTSNLIKLDMEERIRSSIAKDSYIAYQILPLNKSKRAELVNLALPLKLPNASDEEIKALSDKITQALILQRRYIPLTPEIILHVIEYYINYQLEAAQNDASIFGKVFEASITNTLSPWIQSPITVDKAFTVLGKIAFYVHQEKKYPISHKEIVSVIEKYREDYGGRIDELDFINAVLKAKILQKREETGEYKFCNNNYLAYFVAKAICDAKDEEAVKDCLRLACFGINTTILMFITYLTNDLSIIREIYKAATSVTKPWDEFTFHTKEISHINSVKASEPLTPPTDEDIEQDRIADEAQDMAEVQSAIVDIMNVYDFQEEDAEKLENKIIGSISLMLLLARCLPNFEHILRKEQKIDIVRTLYALPNKIFMAWAREVEKDRENFVKYIISLETNDYARQKLLEGGAEALVQWTSLSLLLEFYNGMAQSAYRDNTLEYLDGMALECVDCSESTHALQRLVVLGRAKHFSEFKATALKLLGTLNEPSALLSLKRIVHRFLVEGNMSAKQSAELKSKFFEKENQSKLIYRQQLSQLKE